MGGGAGGGVAACGVSRAKLRQADPASARRIKGTVMLQDEPIALTPAEPGGGKTPAPHSFQPARYSRRTNAFASSRLLNFRFAESHSSLKRVRSSRSWTRRVTLEA